ncbi:RrF2 family transcriptional regulator [Sphingomonas sp.]|uniref:RrF2 family transcriptional regulator n=1 Tax=Sphingomonas sp. TaxID=28214 RepID=UPI003B3B36C4
MLSQKARYALRALLHLVENAGTKPIQLSEVATAQVIPRKYLEFIMVDLKKAGLVNSRRGPGGGYVLARPASEISFVEVIRAIDGPIALVPCASENFYQRCGDCHDEATCAIRRVLARVRDSAVDILGNTSLADAANTELAAEGRGPVAA